MNSNSNTQLISSSVRDREIYINNGMQIATPTAIQQFSSSVPNDYYFEKRSFYSQNNSSSSTPTSLKTGEFISNAEVFISDCPLINQVVFEKWLQGASIEQTSNFLFEKQRASRQEYFAKYSFFIENYFKLIIHEVTYQYRIFTDFQPYLQNPSLFMSCNTILQVAPSVKQSLIQQYFDFDERVYRELMGKKLTSKLRRDLEEISERCNVEIISVRRQFDNLKTIFKFIKAAASSSLSEFITLHKHDNGQSIIARIIQEKFMLSEKLAEYVLLTLNISNIHVINSIIYNNRKYATLVFMIYQRFELNKKVMKDFKFQDIYFLCSQIFKHWTYHTKGTSVSSSIPNAILNHTNTSSVEVSTSPITITTSMNATGEEVQITIFDSHQIAIDFMKFRDIKTIIFSDKIRLNEYIKSIKKELADDKAFTADVLERMASHFNLTIL